MCLGPDQLRAWNKPTQCARWVCLFIDSAMSNLTAFAVRIELPILSKGSSSANHFTNQAPLLCRAFIWYAHSEYIEIEVTRQPGRFPLCTLRIVESQSIDSK